jgi:UTP-glucose-1-phosphate uridylyltransferase
MQSMINEGHKIYASEIQDAIYYDTGNPLDYMKTVIEFGLKRHDMGDELSKYLRDKLL